MGVSFLPRFTILPDLETGCLSALHVKDFHMQIWRQIVYHKDKWVTREMNAFIQLASSMLPPVPGR